jgi:hypothetical protein
MRKPCIKFDVERIEEVETEDKPAERDKLIARLSLTAPGGTTTLLTSIHSDADWKGTFDEIALTLEVFSAPK